MVVLMSANLFAQLPTPLIPYETSMTIEKIGSFPIHLMALKDLDQALDEICKKYDPKTPAEEERLLNLCPYFGMIWPSARALAFFMSERKTQFNKKTGIEVGAGLALPSILAAKIGSTMTVTDFHPDVADWVRRNAELNQVRLNIHTWDWTAPPPPGSKIEFESYDFVLASDVLYERRHPEDLAQALARLVKAKGSIYLSDPGRPYLERALNELAKLGFRRAEFEYQVEESSSRPEIRLEKRRQVWVYELTRD
jgi:predicted nicotinamide N-methyase